jgi:predicted ArsR family transcriptional regulator
VVPSVKRHGEHTFRRDLLVYLAEVEDVVALSAVAALAEPVRRELYAYVRRQGRPVTRDEAAADAGISRKLAAFHLDRLVAAKLLDAGTDGDADGRIGRPPKTYKPSDLEVGVSIPTRRYELAAELLLAAAVTSERDGVTAREALMTAALRRGHEVGTEARHRLRPGRLGPDRALSLVEDVAAECGFEPLRGDRRGLRLRNCPYQRLARHSRELICGMNTEFFTGVVEGTGGRIGVQLVPWDGHCCVELRV